MAIYNSFATIISKLLLKVCGIMERTEKPVVCHSVFSEVLSMFVI
jgi:hypothetical protein